MSRRSEAVSQEYLKEILEYEPKTGVFKWRVSRRRAKKGDIAGSISYHNRRVISIKSLSYTASRLAFLYMTGAFPMYALKHLNNKNDDDRWENIQENTPTVVGKSQNKNKDSKYPGVYWRARKSHWEVQFYTNGRQNVLGYFDKFEDAVECKRKADLGRKTDSAVKDGGVAADVDLELDVRYNKWKATAWVNGCRVYLGLFATREEASDARIEAQAKDALDERGLIKMNRNDTWKCHAVVGGVKKHVGYFDNKVDAMQARDKMEGTDGY